MLDICVTAGRPVFTLNRAENVCFIHRVIFGNSSSSAGLIIERQPLAPDDKPAHLEGKFPLRLDEHPAQKHDRLQQLEDRLPVVDRCPNMVPYVFR
jgi:hypothetical protein